MTVLTCLLTVLLLLMAMPPVSQANTGNEVFRFHVPNEPSSLDPSRWSSTDANYLFHNLYRGLYRYDSRQRLIPEGARECTRPDPLRVICTLNPDFKWSDGVFVEAQHYVLAFRHLVAPGSKSLGVELLQNVVGAMDAYSGKASATQLGVHAQSSQRLEFRLLKPDPDFLYKLTSPILVPIRSESFPDRTRAGQHVYNGPYRLDNWEIGKRLRLSSNSHYTRGRDRRPPIEVLVIDEDATALALYERGGPSGGLSFLRRLPTGLIAKYKGRSDFKQIPMARFDYIGFGPELKGLPKMRQALSLAMDFDELRRIYDALGRPGCPGLPEEIMAETPCLNMNERAAKAAWAQVPAKFREKRWTYAFSGLGGDDIKKGAEWAQQQWRQRLGARVDLAQTEQTLFLSQLREKAPAIFRKGVGLDRPTCLAALETFSPGGAENFLSLDLPEYNEILAQLSRASTVAESRKLCTRGIRVLIKDHWLIPLGRIHFTLLASPRFRGWDLNEMNQLDLAELSPVASK
ncbi:MAG: ABC transporter substrate-binding protein [Bdellovibrionaceae bacterium]|nr:ABC transporter substrate-binding protein [Pseudobdellovibrionaceae bacterium]